MQRMVMIVSALLLLALGSHAPTLKVARRYSTSGFTPTRQMGFWKKAPCRGPAR